MLLPIPGRDWLLVGDEIPKKDRKTTTKTQSGTCVSYTILMSSMRMLITSSESKKVQYKALKAVTVEKGAEMEVFQSLGLTTVDGNHKITFGDSVLISIGTTTMTGQHVRKAVAICSSESALCIDAALEGTREAEHDPAAWYSADTGPGMVLGITRTKARHENTHAVVSCSVHLTEEDMPAHKKKLKDKDNFDSFRKHIKMAAQFVEPTAAIALCAVLQEWKKRGERKYMQWFYDDHIKNNAGWMDGALALGVPTHQQAIERDHQEMNKSILSAIREEKPLARQPLSVTDAVKAIFYKCIPRWSQNIAEFDGFHNIPKTELVQAREFSSDPLLLQLSEKVFCFKQKQERGKLHKVTKREARIAAGLHKKKKWTYSQFKLAACVHFVTPESCYPCHIWACKQVCYHQLAIRSLTGAGPLPGIDDEDVMERKARKGRPARKRAKFMRERLFDAHHRR